jgi:AraC family transcriptional regulator
MSHVSHKYLNARVTASSAQRDWPGQLAELLTHPEGRVGPFASALTELTFVLDKGGSVLRQLEGAPPQAFEAVSGAMWLTPGDAREEFIEFESSVPQALHIYLKPDWFRFVCPGVQERNSHISALRGDAPFHDSLLAEIARAVAAELWTPSHSSYSMIGALSSCLAARLLQAHLDVSRVASFPQETSRLDKRRLEQVKAHVAAHLDRHLSVTELAKVAALSPSRFAHTFKILTGESPQRYVSAQRLERAKVLLCDRILPLVEVADRCGFSNQASFSTAFARAARQSPGQYRHQCAERQIDGQQAGGG